MRTDRSHTHSSGSTGRAVSHRFISIEHGKHTRNNNLQQQLCNVAHMNIIDEKNIWAMARVPDPTAHLPRPNSTAGGNFFNNYHNNKFLLLLLLDLQLKICCSASLILLFEFSPRAARDRSSSCGSMRAQRPQRPREPRLRRAVVCCAMCTRP